MAYEKDKDKHLLSAEVSTGDVRIRVFICQYDGGPLKIGTARVTSRKTPGLNDRTFKLGRMTRDESELVANAIKELWEEWDAKLAKGEVK